MTACKFCGIEMLCRFVDYPFVLDIDLKHIAHISVMGLECVSILNFKNLNILHRQTIAKMINVPNG